MTVQRSSLPGSPDAVEYAGRRCGYRSAERYRARAEFVFAGVDVGGRTLLDVGCGPGTFALWAGLHGARRVVGIEPETDGSTPGTSSTFQETVLKLGLQDVVEARKAFLEDMRPEDGPFDVAVLYNVINHIDEDAVQRLPEPSAVEAYGRVLAHLASLMSPGGDVIVADAARHNLWGDRGLTSPFARTIEWEKHADPSVWADVFASAGFREVTRRWSPAYPLGRLSSNRAFQYATYSHFVSRFRAPL